MATGRLVDLTQPINATMPMFPGLPRMELSAVVSREQSREVYAEGVEFLIQRIAITGNSGTYIDAPYHRYTDGNDLAQLPLASTVGLQGVRVDARDATTSGRRTIDASFLNGTDLRGCAVLFWTGWDERWPTECYLEPNPFISGEFAERLIEAGVALVGIDSWNIDDVQDGHRPVHSALLRNGIPIVENLCHLDQLSGEAFRFYAAPLPIQQGTAVPVRAYAIEDN